MANPLLLPQRRAHILRSSLGTPRPLPNPAATDVIEATKMVVDPHSASVEDGLVLDPLIAGVVSVAHLVVDVNLAGTLLLAGAMTIEIARDDVAMITANEAPLGVAVADPHPQMSCHMSRDWSSLIPSSHLEASAFSAELFSSAV